MKTVTLVKDYDGVIKTPQINAMLNVLKNEAGIGNATPLADLFPKIDADTENFKSRQGAARVWKFYEKKMIEAGLITVEGADPKPAKAEGDAPKRTRRKKGEAAPAEGGESTEQAEA